MVMAALSPNSILASPIQVNPQVRTDVQSSAPQVAQDAQTAVAALKTDTITISAQALKMADDTNASARESLKAADEQETAQMMRAKSEKNEIQKNAEKAYAAMTAPQ